ncbi:MAG: GGDEF domain-containing protein [Thermomicrobiales bacterium]
MATIGRYLWIAILFLGLALTAVYVGFAEPAETIAYYSAGVMSLSAAVFAVWHHQPKRRSPWLLLISGIATLLTADLIWDNYESLFGHEAGNPSVADMLYVAGFGAVILAFLRWNRHVNYSNGREDSLDAGIVSIGIAVVAWVFAIEPRLGATDLNMGAQILSVTYPLLDLFLLTVLVRIMMRPGVTFHRPLVLFILGTLSFGIADALWGWGELTDTYAAVAAIADAGWMLSYVFWGAAAAHPATIRLERTIKYDSRPTSYLSTRRAISLFGAALMVPILVVFNLFQELTLDILVLITSGTILFALVISRMQTIVRSLESAMVKQVKLQEDLHFAAYHDPLTGLANRALLNASLEDMIEQRRQKSIALLFLDLDNFKDINDQLGHAVGDRLLVEVAEKLGGCIRPQDLIGRMGGDEFVILLRFDGDPPLDTSVAISERILDAFEPPMTIDGKQVQIGASIGIAWLGNEHVSIDSIFRAADHAMYDAKRSGKNRYSVAPVLCPAVDTGDRPSVERSSQLPMQLHPVAAPNTGLSNSA